MVRIRSIEAVERLRSAAGKDYIIVRIITTDQDEAEIYIGVGDEIKVYHDDKYNKVKAEKIYGRQTT